MIVISRDIIEKPYQNGRRIDVFFNSWDQGDVYNLFSHAHSLGSVPGSIQVVNQRSGFSISRIGKKSDRVRIVLRQEDERSCQEASKESFLDVRGYVLNEPSWQEMPVQIVPVRNEIFSRFGGLLETDVLAGKRVLIIGLGSGGSLIAIELAKSGITDFILMDHDRLEVANVGRHAAGLSHVGRFKTKAIRELIIDKNPYAKVRTYEDKVSWVNVGKVREIVKEADIIVCATDDRPSKLLLNRIIVEEHKPCVFAGAFRRAYGGQVLFVRPESSLCYQCFCMLLPEQAEDQEISSQEQAEGLAYTDRPVPIEPGLSIDIAPISLMVVKLVIQELLKDSTTTLRSLDDDLVAPWYLWINRRELGTQYEKMKPLAFNIDGLHVLRWYGVSVERHPDCPVCGDFEGHLAREFGVTSPT